MGIGIFTGGTIWILTPQPCQNTDRCPKTTLKKRVLVLARMGFCRVPEIGRGVQKRTQQKRRLSFGFPRVSFSLSGLEPLGFGFGVWGEAFHHLPARTKVSDPKPDHQPTNW